MDERPPVGNASARASHLSDAAIGISWFALPIFAILTLIAMIGEMFTKFANAGFGYYFILLGMPAFCVAWFSLLVYASFRPVPPSWCVSALIAAMFVVVGYANIG
jgi:hypothetical protein